MKLMSWISPTLASLGQWLGQRVSELTGQFWRRAVVLLLVAALGLGGCSSAGVSGQVTGDYSQDALTLIDTLRTAISLPDDAPDKGEAQASVRAVINDFSARYRRDNAVAGLSSFTTVSTAMNAIAGHYSSYPNRPFPEKLKQRLEQELRQVESALRRGA